MLLLTFDGVDSESLEQRLSGKLEEATFGMSSSDTASLHLATSLRSGLICGWCQMVLDSPIVRINIHSRCFGARLSYLSRSGESQRNTRAVEPKTERGPRESLESLGFGS